MSTQIISLAEAHRAAVSLAGHHEISIAEAI